MKTPKRTMATHRHSHCHCMLKQIMKDVTRTQLHTDEHGADLFFCGHYYYQRCCVAFTIVIIIVVDVLSSTRLALLFTAKHIGIRFSVYFNNNNITVLSLPACVRIARIIWAHARPQNCRPCDNGHRCEYLAVNNTIPKCSHENGTFIQSDVLVCAIF